MGKWDCNDCLSYKNNIRRNCGGKFPNSDFARKGYPVSDFKIFECPKTYIKNWALHFIELIDAHHDLKTPLAEDLSKLPSRFVKLWQIVETEKAKVRNDLFQLHQSKSGGT